MEQKLIEIIYDKFGEEYGFELPEDKLFFERISDASRKAIIELNSINRTEINIPSITSDSSGPLRIKFSVTKDFINNYSVELLKENWISRPNIFFPDKKIFGIGFHKTGTTTLDKALTLLGYNVTGKKLDLVEDIKQNNYNSIIKLVNEFDAFQDNPWPLLYRFLDKQFPNSKFILTIRDDEKWLKSIVNFFGEKDTEMRKWIYGVGHPKGNEEIYLNKYKKHNNDVKDYFKNRKEDLLIIDYSKGSSWEKICNFVEKEIPNKPFPHEKKTNYSEKKLLKKIYNKLVKK